MGLDFCTFEIEGAAALTASEAADGFAGGRPAVGRGRGRLRGFWRCGGGLGGLRRGGASYAEGTEAIGLDGW